MHPNYNPPEARHKECFAVVYEPGATAAEISEQQATEPTAEPSEVPEQQSQSVNQRFLSIVYVYAYATSTNGVRGEEQRDQNDLTHEDVVAKATPEDPLPVRDAMDTGQISGDEQLSTIDPTREDVTAEATREDLLPVSDEMDTDQIPGDEQVSSIDLTREDVTAEATRDGPPTVDPIITDHTRTEEEDFSDIIDWDASAQATPNDLPTVDSINTDHTDQQGGYSEIIDWDASTQATPNDFPTVDSINTDHTLAEEQGDYYEPNADLIARADEKMIRIFGFPIRGGVSMGQTSKPNDEDLVVPTSEDVSPNIDDMDIGPDPASNQHGAQDDELYGFRLFGHKALMDFNDTEKEALARFFACILPEFNAEELRDLQETRL